MYKVGDTIVYSDSGVCEIVGMTTRQIMDKVLEYYVLNPIYSKNSKIFVPVGNEELVDKMKDVLTKSEICSLIQEMPNSEFAWIDNNNQRKEKFKEIIKSGNRFDLVSLIRTLYLRKKGLVEEGKKLPATDEQLYKDAEKMLFEEFAYVLDIKEDEVSTFIKNEMKDNKKILV